MSFVGHRSLDGWLHPERCSVEHNIKPLQLLTKAVIWVAWHSPWVTCLQISYWGWSAESDWTPLTHNFWAYSFKDFGCCHQGLHCCARWPYVWRRPLKMNSLWAIFFRSRWIHRGQFFRFGKWDDWKRCTLATSVTNVTNTNTNTNTNANTKHNTNANIVMEQMQSGHFCAVELSCALA